ncbi:hypothetical protein [Streptomyces sp. NPDC018031]|uniref:hypothetical protein n=1 Tax=Streptomyces sp. NPDC018031 TaxID=3365033 RepID=UPI0037AF44F5
MPDVSDEQRQRVKQEATRAALLDNNAAAALVVAGGIASFVSPAHGIVLGIGSGLFWLCANYRQSIANDPPRDDFYEVWITTASMDESSLPGDEPLERSIYRFHAQHLLVCDGLYALLRSLERYDGANSAGATEAVAAQVDAIQWNAASVADHQDALVALAPEVNQAWVSLRAEHGLDWSTASLGELQQFYRDTVGELPPPQRCTRGPGRQHPRGR